MIFYEAEISQVRHVKAILTIFESISGLQVNWQKSCLYPLNKVHNMEILASNLGCQVVAQKVSRDASRCKKQRDGGLGRSAREM